MVNSHQKDGKLNKLPHQMLKQPSDEEKERVLDATKSSKNILNKHMGYPCFLRTKPENKLELGFVEQEAYVVEGMRIEAEVYLFTVAGLTINTIKCELAADGVWDVRP